MPDEPQDTPANDTPEGEAQPDARALGWQKRIRAQLEAEALSPEIIFNSTIGALVDLDVAAQVAAEKTRETGDLEAHLLAVQLQHILAAASRLILENTGSSVQLARCSKEQEAKAREALASAANDYLMILGFGEPHRPIKKQEEAAYIVRLAQERMCAAGGECSPGELAFAAILALRDYVLRSFKNYPLAALITPPIAAALIRLPEPTEEVSKRAISEAAIAIDQETTGRTSAEAARRAIVAIVRCLGVPAKDANNWFRPT